MPSEEAIFASLVRVPYLWTPQEYAYIQHFHKVYGFDPDSHWLTGRIAYDEWMYWHFLAVARYSMHPRELSKHLASMPATRPLVWRFESFFDAEKSKARRQKWQACMPWGNHVPYTAPHMQ